MTEKNLASAAFLAKSLADENRLRILLCLGSGKKSVSQIVEELSLSQPLISHHLKELGAPCWLLWKDGALSFITP